MSYLKDVLKGPSGIASDPKNLDYWSDRAEKNSLTATRAKGGKMDLPSTGGEVRNRSTSSQPKNFNRDPYDEARRDLNYSGSSTYMPNVRRTSR
jgi:hypothetical protein